MKIDMHEMAGVKVVRVEGKLDTNTTPEAELRLNEAVDQGASKILIDFENLDFVSSAGLRILLSTAKKLSARSGALRVCGLNETVRDIFDMSGFSTLLRVFDNEQDALADF
ncbi:MAG: STAS domain-containing protein [Planctomycetota bacterium]|jgi:anti-anti-sigma factor